MLLQLHSALQQLQFILLHVSVFSSAYTWSATESTLKSEAEGKGVPLRVMHEQQQQQQQQHEDRAVEKPQDILGMCPVERPPYFIE